MDNRPDAFVAVVERDFRNELQGTNRRNNGKIAREKVDQTHSGDRG